MNSGFGLSAPSALPTSFAQGGTSSTLSHSKVRDVHEQNGLANAIWRRIETESRCSAGGDAGAAINFDSQPETNHCQSPVSGVHPKKNQGRGGTQ